MKAIGSAGISALWAKAKEAFAAKSHTHDYLPLSGGALTGNLTGKYITGTWLQATASNHSADKQSRVVVQDSGGWLYSRTPDELRSDIGAAPTSAATQTAAGLMSAADKAKLDGLSDSGGGGDYLSDADFITYVTE